MKTMTCKQLGGACDKAFTASSFEEMTEMSKAHGMEMFQKQDPEQPSCHAKNYGDDARPRIIRRMV